MSETNTDTDDSRYEIDVSDTADQEADAIYLWLSQNRGPEAADRWYRGLYTAYDRLRQLPYRNAALPHQPSVRRLLYNPYRVLYRIVEPVREGESKVVRILRIIHGARITAVVDDQEDSE